MESFQMESSPFEIPLDQLEVLYQSQTFQLLRDCLASQASFCRHHSNGDKQTQETWILHRDMLHALIMPIVEVFRRASTLAAAALCATKSEDLELAFAGEARGAFVWLQCFLSEEPTWCQSRGCPACVTMETLRTEHHIRLTIAASLVSTASLVSADTSPAASSPSSPTEESFAPYETAARTLPPLPQILPALRTALENDAFWGPEYWTYLFDKGVILSNGIKALIASCVDLEALVATPVTRKPAARRCVTTPGLVHLHTREDDEKGVRLRNSKLAKRQLRMKGEEIEIMRRCALQCWAKAAIPSRMRNQLLGRDREERRRRLTAP